MIRRSRNDVDADLTGKTCIVTGSNTGIGKEIARGLADLGASLVMACRSETRAAEARDDLVEDTGNDAIEVRILDLARQTTIRSFAEEFLEERDRLDVLVNNAGIFPSERRESPDGIERTWAVNALGPWLLTNLLRERLEETAPARVVTVASELARDLDIDDLEFEERSFSGMKAYAQSKQANRMLSWELDRRLEGSGVTVNVAHPGFVASDLQRKQPWWIRMFLPVVHLFARSNEQGADTPVWLAASPELEGVSGRFWMDRKERPRSYDDPEACRALWEKCEEMVSSTAPAS